MYNIYKTWLLNDNPFDTSSLPAKEIGISLITGRDEEIRMFSRKLFNQPQIVTVEGANGIGKTSLINVAIYRLLLSYFNNKDNHPLFIPCLTNFQLSENKNSEDLLNEVFFQIAYTIIEFADDLKNAKVSIPKNIREVDTWLNSMKTSNFEWEGSLGPVSANYSNDHNQSFGFEKTGFINIIKRWLSQIFPTKNNGGIVCIIDNMELLESSERARRTIENLRDTLFNQHGIRWVLCGSNGIISSIVASPRLEGVLHQPIVIREIPKMYIKELFKKRINFFKKSDDYYIPITENSFKYLYETLSCNIRNTLNYSNEFCLWVCENNRKPSSDKEKEDLFYFWLQDKSKVYLNDIKKHIKIESLELFSKIIRNGSNFTLDDYEYFDFSSRDEFKSPVKDLEKVALINKIIDESDCRKKLFQITPKGLFVSYSLKKV